MSRTHNQYKLDINKAVRAIRAFNDNPCAQTVEQLLDLSFSDFHRALAPASVQGRTVEA